MSVPPLVSVVVPAWNVERYLAATVASVQAQTMAEWELIIVDDGSTDGTAAVASGLAAGDARIRVIRQENQGIARARNRGFEATDAASRFVAFLDSDDVWEPDALAVLLAAFQAHPACVSAHGLVRCIDPAGRPVPGDTIEQALRSRRGFAAGHLVEWPEEAPTSFGVLAFDNCIVTPGVQLIRREAYGATGGFDETVVPCDDWDMSLRLSRLGDIAYVPRALLQWRRHPHSASNVLASRWRRSYYATRDKLLAYRDNTPDQYRAALLGYRQAWIGGVRDALRAARRGRATEAARTLARAAYGAARYVRAMQL